MFLTHERDNTERYFFFSHGSSNAGKNELISIYLFTASFYRQ